MIDIKELRIGNQVRWKGFISKVQTIEGTNNTVMYNNGKEIDWDNSKTAKPIPLTENHLLRFKALKRDDNWFDLTYCSHEEVNSIQINLTSGTWLIVHIA
jgi:hypothetical protein